MLSENLIHRIKTIIEDTILTYRGMQGHFDSVRVLNGMTTADTFNVSADLSQQLEHALIKNLAKAQKGKGYEDVLYANKMPLEVKVVSTPILQVSLNHKVDGKTYILVHHQDCFLKKIYFLPFAKDYYFYKASPNAHSRKFNYTKYKTKLIKIRYSE